MGDEARFWAKVNKDGPLGCWLWTAHTSVGYGHFRLDGRDQGAHRIAYEWLVGPIPDGLQIDHLCRVRNCVNPAHMEPVTIKENLLRGETWNAKNAAKTHCPKGHPLVEGNLVRHQLEKRGQRTCLTCRRERNRIAERARYAAKRDEINARRRKKVAA